MYGAAGKATTRVRSGSWRNPWRPRMQQVGVPATTSPRSQRPAAAPPFQAAARAANARGRYQEKHRHRVVVAIAPELPDREWSPGIDQDSGCWQPSCPPERRTAAMTPRSNTAAGVFSHKICRSRRSDFRGHAQRPVGNPLPRWSVSRLEVLRGNSDTRNPEARPFGSTGRAL